MAQKVEITYKAQVVSIYIPCICYILCIDLATFILVQDTAIALFLPTILFLKSATVVRLLLQLLLNLSAKLIR